MSDQPTADATASADAGQLAKLGYTSQFNREMNLRENFSLGFTYLSPVVGIYSLFALALAAGGPPMIWWLLIVGLGQLMVALIFSEVVSQFPIAGGVYPWARRLWGRKWAWMAGWIYGWALLATIASVTYGAGPFVAALFGLESSQNLTIIIALILIVIVTLVNLQGTAVLGKVALFGFVAEIVGALVVGGWLLIAHREQNWGVIFDDFGLVDDAGSYVPAFIAAALIGLYQYYGFEACGDVAARLEAVVLVEADEGCSDERRDVGTRIVNEAEVVEDDAPVLLAMGDEEPATYDQGADDLRDEAEEGDLAEHRRALQVHKGHDDDQDQGDDDREVLGGLQPE